MIDLTDPKIAEAIGRDLGRRLADCRFRMATELVELDAVGAAAVLLAERREAAEERFHSAQAEWIATARELVDRMAERRAQLEAQANAAYADAGQAAPKPAHEAA